MGIMVHLVETGQNAIDLHFNTDKIIYLEDRRREGLDTEYSIHFNTGGSANSTWEISEKSFKEISLLMNHGTERVVTITEETESAIL